MNRQTQLVKGMEELGPFSSVPHFWVNVPKWNKTYMQWMLSRPLNTPFQCFKNPVICRL